VLAALWEQQGQPVELLWVGQGFRWDNRRVETFDARDIPPNMGSSSMPLVSRLGVTLFPVVWTKGSRGGLTDLDRRLSDAGKVANYFGGSVSECQGNVAPCLDQFFEKNSRGWVLSVAGPAVKEWNRWYWPEMTVHVSSGQGASPDTLQRRFAVPASGPESLQSSTPFVLAATPLFSTGLDAIPGCGSEQRKRCITLLVPRSVIVKGGPHFRVYTSILNAPQTGTSPKAFKTRNAVDVTVDQNGTGPARACVDLPSPTETPAVFGIILYNRDIYWAGTARIEDTKSAN
jgi:hypothetical protein